jgi:hypothetical protein
MRGDTDRSQHLPACRIEGVQLFSGRKPGVLTVRRDEVIRGPPLFSRQARGSVGEEHGPTLADNENAGIPRNDVEVLAIACGRPRRRPGCKDDGDEDLSKSVSVVTSTLGNFTARANQSRAECVGQSAGGFAPESSSRAFGTRTVQIVSAVWYYDTSCEHYHPGGRLRKCSLESERPPAPILSKRRRF